MRYFFESKIKKAEEGYWIPIPFNVWEVCRQRDQIDADIVLDNRIISCVLLPEDKGIYHILLSKEELEGVDIKKEHKILLHVTGSVIRMDQKSPYSFENPIRKIDSMELILQPGDGLCGQTCVAMLAGVTIADVITVMDCREWQGTMGRLISALNYYGIDHSDVLIYPGDKDHVVLPKCAILMEKMGRYAHYLIHYDGDFYDPNLGILDEEYDYDKLLGYLEIKC